ncbi:hypothetical protein MMC17_003272 [Xylographa soralifera]|nr:hypothetical protein [Xylographa soralifera]
MATNHPTIPTTYVTTHDAEGRGIFSSLVSQAVIPNIAILYSAPSVDPVDFNNDTDISFHNERPSTRPLVPTTGVTTVVVEWPPGYGITEPARLHRTLSLDIGVMIAGEVELILGSGEKRTLKGGDVLVHRGTMHSWRNASETETARMVLVVLPSERVIVDGKALE